jgi:hypothetical protein
MLPLYKVDSKNYTSFSLVKAAFPCFPDNRFNIGDAYSSSSLNINIYTTINLYSKGLSPYIDII